MNEFKQRIFTSFTLILILYLSFLNYLILSSLLFLILFITLYEFNNIFSAIFKQRKAMHLLIIFLTTLYVFYFLISILMHINFSNYDNKEFLLFILSISISTDIGGYCFGKVMKGKKISKISPNKTYSGLMGSFITSMIVTSFFFRNLDLSFNYLIVTIIISLISQAGDLFVSYLKRLANIKDTGKLLPGHGGLLDRIDGILFSIPIGLIIINL